MLSVKKSTSSLSFKRGDAYVKRDSSLHNANGCIDCITINDSCRYLELVILKRERVLIMDFERLGIIPKEDVTKVEEALKDAGYTLRKRSLNRGYVSRRTAGTLEAYKGKYGVGYKWLLPNYCSNRYMTVEYWVK